MKIEKEKINTKISEKFIDSQGRTQATQDTDFPIIDFVCSGEDSLRTLGRGSFVQDTRSELDKYGGECVARRRHLSSVETVTNSRRHEREEVEVPSLPTLHVSSQISPSCIPSPSAIIIAPIQCQ